jgi:hypothetical protein
MRDFTLISFPYAPDVENTRQEKQASYGRDPFNFVRLQDACLFPAGCFQHPAQEPLRNVSEL